MIIEETGWYKEEVDGSLNLIAHTKEELADYLDKEGELDYLVIEYVCVNFDMEDFISEIMCGREYMDRDDMVESFIESEIEEGKDFDSGYVWYTWYDKGTEIEEDD